MRQAVGHKVCRRAIKFEHEPVDVDQIDILTSDKVKERRILIPSPLLAYASLSWGWGGERRGGPGAERGREMRWALASAEAGGAHGWRGCEVRRALASAGQARGQSQTAAAPEEE